MMVRFDSIEFQPAHPPKILLSMNGLFRTIGSGLYFPNIISIKTTHIIYGNIISLENITLIQYNKGPSYMENSIVPLEDFLGTHKPSICMLSEANFSCSSQPKIDSTSHPFLSGYALEGGGHTNGTDRTRITGLIDKNIEYIHRHDLEPNGLQTVFLELSISRFKNF